MSTRAVASLMLVVAVLAGCTDTASDTSHRGSGVQSPASASTESMIYSVVLRQLVSIDNTSAMSHGVSPVEHLYIVDGTAPGSPEQSFDAEGGPFSGSLKSEIIRQSSDLPPVEFVATTEQKIDPNPENGNRVDNDGIIIGLGPIEHQADDVVHVGAGFYCGNLCGHGLKYIVKEIDAHWRIAGTTGPRSIS